MFGVGGVATRGDARAKVFFDPRLHVLRGDAIKRDADRSRGGRFEQRREAGEKTCEAALGMLAFQLLVETKRRFKDLSAHRQSLAFTKLLFRIMHKVDQTLGKGLALAVLERIADLASQGVGRSLEKTLLVHEGDGRRNHILALLPDGDIVGIVRHSAKLVLHPRVANSFP